MPSGAESKIREAIDIALKYQAEGRLRAAGSIYRRVLRVDPDNPDALHFLGVIAHKIGRPDLAMELLARSIAADPNRVGFRLNLGSLYLKRQQVEEAIACYRDAVALEPESASAYAHLAAALARQGKLEEANDAFARATELKAQPQADLPRDESVTTTPAPVDAASSEPEVYQAEPGLADTLGLLDEPADEAGPGGETESIPSSDSSAEIVEVGPDSLSEPEPSAELALHQETETPLNSEPEVEPVEQLLEQPSELALYQETETPLNSESEVEPVEQLLEQPSELALYQETETPLDSEPEVEPVEQLLEQPSELALYQETETPLDSEPEVEPVEQLPEQPSELALYQETETPLDSEPEVEPVEQLPEQPSELTFYQETETPLDSEPEVQRVEQLLEQQSEMALPVETEVPLQLPIASEPDETEIAREIVEQSFEIAPGPADETFEGPIAVPATGPEEVSGAGREIAQEPHLESGLLPSGELAETADEVSPHQAGPEPAPAPDALPVELLEAAVATPLPERSLIVADESPISDEPIDEPGPVYEVEPVKHPAVEPATEVVLDGPIEFVIPVEPEAGSVEPSAVTAPEMTSPVSIDFVIPVEPEIGRVTASDESAERAAKAALALQYAWALRFDSSRPIPSPVAGIPGIDEEESQLDRELFALPKDGAMQEAAVVDDGRPAAPSLPANCPGADEPVGVAEPSLTAYEPDPVDMIAATPVVDAPSDRHAFVGIAGSVPQARAGVADELVGSADPARVTEEPADVETGTIADSLEAHSAGPAGWTAALTAGEAAGDAGDSFGTVEAAPAEMVAVMSPDQWTGEVTPFFGFETPEPLTAISVAGESVQDARPASIAREPAPADAAHVPSAVEAPHTPPGFVSSALADLDSEVIDWGDDDHADGILPEPLNGVFNLPPHSWSDMPILPLPDPDPVEPAPAADTVISDVDAGGVWLGDPAQPENPGPSLAIPAFEDDALIDLGLPHDPVVPEVLVLELDDELNVGAGVTESEAAAPGDSTEEAEEPFELDDDSSLMESLEPMNGVGESIGGAPESAEPAAPAEPTRLVLNVEEVSDPPSLVIDSPPAELESKEPSVVDAVPIPDMSAAGPDTLDAVPVPELVPTGVVEPPEQADAAVEGSPEPQTVDEPAMAGWSDDAVAAPLAPEEPTATVPVGEAVEPGISLNLARPVDQAAGGGEDELEPIHVRPGLLGEAHAQVLAGRYEPAVDGVVGVVVPAIDRSAETLPLPSTPALRGGRRAVPAVPAAGRARPPSAESLRRRGVSLVKFRRLDEAIGLFKQAVSIRPKFAEAHRDLGGAMLRQGNLEGAITSLQRALQLRPGFAEAWGSLGDAYQLEGKISQAIRCYRRLLEIVPRAAKVHSNMLLSMNYDPQFSAEEVFHEHLLWVERHAERHFRDIQPHTNDRTPGRRLMIGYVSPDFRRHSVNYFAEPVLAGHYRRDFHVTCYSDVLRPDGVTRGLAELSDDFRDTHAMNDEQLAAQVRADGIDILIDLSGHTGNNRLGTFARKPAPVQVTYLGYPNTTGLSTMDYRITDALADPPGATERFHSEQLVRLPDTFLCYQPPQGSPEVGPLPCLEAGYVTFGCFNILAKITDDVMALWARILQELPKSRLVLKGRSNALAAENRRRHVRNIFVNHGISPDRLELLGKEPSYAQHLTHYRRLDIVLDPFPYTGTTTTCEALWMGLPVVTLAGDRHVSRVGVSILNNVGLPELIADTPEQYVRIATGLADSPKNLSRLRSTLRDRMHRSPLTDSIRLTRALEAEYRKMWVHWCQSEHGEPAPRDTLTLTDG